MGADPSVFGVAQHHLRYTELRAVLGREVPYLVGVHVLLGWIGMFKCTPSMDGTACLLAKTCRRVPAITATLVGYAVILRPPLCQFPSAQLTMAL